MIKYLKGNKVNCKEIEYNTIFTYRFLKFIFLVIILLNFFLTFNSYLNIQIEIRCTLVVSIWFTPLKLPMLRRRVFHTHSFCLRQIFYTKLVKQIFCTFVSFPQVNTEEIRRIWKHQKSIVSKNKVLDIEKQTLLASRKV